LTLSWHTVKPMLYRSQAAANLIQASSANALGLTKYTDPRLAMEGNDGGLMIKTGCTVCSPKLCHDQWGSCQNHAAL